MAQTYIEADCTITHDGHAFESGGAIVTDDRIVAYLATGEQMPTGGTGFPWRSPFTVTDWHGARIGTASVTGAWTVGGRFGTRMYSYRVRLDDGRWYNARGQGEGMILTGRRATV